MQIIIKIIIIKTTIITRKTQFSVLFNIRTEPTGVNVCQIIVLNEAPRRNFLPFSLK